MGGADGIVGGRRLHVVLDGQAWDPVLQRALEPLIPRVMSVDAWPPGPGTAADALLSWLGVRFPERPLLGLTRRPLLDGDLPLRGLSRLASGLALASGHGLDPRVLAGVLLHETAHALGLDHCAGPGCALEERPWPLDVDDRPPRLCPACREAWLRRCGP